MADNSIFSKEVLDELTVSEGNSNNVPVTVLGKTFANDDERREYFRGELRKKLPELKKIDGYPIGDDDDIVNLSDPPYYTACPNPWINDFIKEWEADKARLQAEGKRTADFEVKEPYSSDVTEGKNNPIYNAHSYHTKVPHPAIMRYILHYTQPGDIIFDGFCGTGMTGVAANMCEHPSEEFKLKIESESNVRWGKRNAIQSDISPVASLICANLNSPISQSDVFERIENIINDVELKYGWLYKTKDSSGFLHDINYVVWSDVFVCPSCSNKVVFYDAAVDHSSGKVSDEFSCPHCGTILTKRNAKKSFSTLYDTILDSTISVQEKKPVFINYQSGKKSYNKPLNEEDIALIQKADELSKNFSITKDRMIDGAEGRRNDRQGLTHVHHFYFSRSLIIFEEILSRCNDKEIRFLINSQLINVSKLNRFRPGVSFPYNPLSGTLYIGSQISESNVFVALKNKLKRIKTLIPEIGAKNITSDESATSVSIHNNSVDYIFTDPPFGANIPYSELNFIQESWLRVKTNTEKEAIVNQSYHKTLFDYQVLMTESLKEFYRVLKPGKWLTMEFSNTSAAVWNSIQNALQGVGFIVANVSALDKEQGSFKAVTTPTAVKQDLIISCFKPTSELSDLFKKSSDKADNVWDFVEELLEHLPVHIKKDNSTTAVVERSPKILFDRLIAYYVQKGYPVPLDATTFQKGVKERFVERDGMYFTATQANEYEEKKKDTAGFNNLFVFIDSEAEGIEWLKRKLAEGPKTYSEIQPEWMKDLRSPKKGDNLPELMLILEENFIKEPDGKWRLPNIQDDVDKNQLRTKALLREFKLYVEMASKPKAKIKEVRVEAVRAGFKDCYIRKDFQTIVMVGDKIPQNLLTEDEILLQFYDIAVNHI